jgi:hypothetical protein
MPEQDYEGISKHFALKTQYFLNEENGRMPHFYKTI